MSRFQALTNPLLDEELDALRAELGLRENQRAELLREMAAIASWVVAQARAGRIVEARGPDGVEVLRHPAVNPRPRPEPLLLADDEAAALGYLLERDGPPSPAVRDTLRRIAEGEPLPELTWPDDPKPRR
jgi:hypothetical protein